MGGKQLRLINARTSVARSGTIEGGFDSHANGFRICQSHLRILDITHVRCGLPLGLQKTKRASWCLDWRLTVVAHHLGELVSSDDTLNCIQEPVHDVKRHRLRISPRQRDFDLLARCSHCPHCIGMRGANGKKAILGHHSVWRVADARQSSSARRARRTTARVV